MNIKIEHASLDDIEQITVLFDEYRMFYGEKSDIPNSVLFLKERLVLGETQILVARTANNEIVGFTQLFPSFSSVTMQRLWILNDLYVDKKHRKFGIGRKLLNAAAIFGQSTNAKQLFIEGAVSNANACKLYEDVGFKKNSEYNYYHLPLNK